MSNPLKGESSFVIEGKTYTLRFTFEALVQIEQRFGKRIDQAFGDLLAEDAPVLMGLRFMMWQGLRHHHPDLTEADVGDSIIMPVMRDRKWAELLEQALTTAFPAPRDEPADPPKPPAGTGVH